MKRSIGEPAQSCGMPFVIGGSARERGCNDHQFWSARLASTATFSTGQGAPASIQALSKAISRGVRRLPVGGIISDLSALLTRRMSSLVALFLGTITAPPAPPFMAPAL